MRLEINNFYSDTTLFAFYDSLKLPSGLQADASCKVELAFRCLCSSDPSYPPSSLPIIQTADVVVSNNLGTVLFTVPAGTLKPGFYCWRAVLIDGSGNRGLLDKDEVKVEDFYG